MMSPYQNVNIMHRIPVSKGDFKKSKKHFLTAGTDKGRHYEERMRERRLKDDSSLYNFGLIFVVQL